MFAKRQNIDPNTLGLDVSCLDLPLIAEINEAKWKGKIRLTSTTEAR